MDIYTKFNNIFFSLITEDTIEPSLETVYNQIRNDPVWNKAVEYGRPRPGHPEGTIRLHVDQVEEYIDKHKNEVSENDYWRLKIMALVHDAFKGNVKDKKTPILDPGSHASLGRKYIANFLKDHDMEMMLQYHDYPFTLWKKAMKGHDVSDRIQDTLSKIKNKKVYNLFMAADGSGPGKDPEPLEWWQRVTKGGPLTESINDKYLFKAVILAGGPGSGKTFVREIAFERDMIPVVASDVLFEYMLKKKGLNLKIDQDKPDYQTKMNIREKAKGSTSFKASQYINGMLPIIIESTGDNFSKISSLKEHLNEIGYDCGMLFVNTSLNVALQRNQERERTLSHDVTSKSWNVAQQNLNLFKQLFKDNLIIINNNSRLNDEELRLFKQKVVKETKQLIKKPLVNPKGKKILAMMGQKGASYLSDIGIKVTL